MKKNIFLSLAILTGIGLSASGQKISSKAEIMFGAWAPNIARITADSLLVISGSTYRFTVDTPEDKGLVTTNITVNELPLQIAARDGAVQKYAVLNRDGTVKTEGMVANGDRLQVISADGKVKRIYRIGLKNMALSGRLVLKQKAVTVHTPTNLELCFTAGQRSPDASISIYFPKDIEVNTDHITVNVIGRGNVKLKDLATQSIGRVGTRYSYKKVGEYHVSKTKEGGSVLVFEHLDLRPANGADLKMIISGVKFVRPGNYPFTAVYSTSQPELLSSSGTGTETTLLTVTNTLANFERVIVKGLRYQENPETYTKVNFKFALSKAPADMQLMQSLDKGKSWSPSVAVIDKKTGTATVSNLKPDQFYAFRLLIKGGPHKGFSNIASFYSGKLDVKSFGIKADGKADHTAEVNQAISYLNQIGGGTLLFSEGTYNVRTVHLKSNVYL